MIGIATGFTRYFLIPCKWWESILLVICGVLMVDAGNVTDLIGIALFAVIIGIQLARRKKQTA